MTRGLKPGSRDDLPIYGPNCQRAIDLKLFKLMKNLLTNRHVHVCTGLSFNITDFGSKENTLVEKFDDFTVNVNLLSKVFEAIRVRDDLKGWDV